MSERPALDRQLWDIVVAPSQRGMAELAGVVRPDLFTAAARAVLDASGPVTIGTGFPIGGPPETDGPPGAFALADALRALGREASIATWPAAAEIFAGARPDLAYVPVNRRPARCRPAADDTFFIAIEICGRSEDGTYRDMRHNDISDLAPKFEEVFGTHAPIAIGDGGNEFGMGNLPQDFVDRWELVKPVSTCDHLLPGTTSNFAAYALVAALGVATGRALLPDPVDHLETIRELVRHGCVDGVSAERAEKVDGLDLAVTDQVLRELRKALS